MEDEKGMWYTMNDGYRAWGVLKSVLSNRGLGIKAKKWLHEGVIVPTASDTKRKSYFFLQFKGKDISILWSAYSVIHITYCIIQAEKKKHELYLY